ncbi:pyridoxal phosphate-dependent class II aminotransferase [Lysinibacillus yapensis]|uniref:Aminotransferase n=1 Tax=Ureibacillus yapensis TaxID=2304605 RepID=A0A396SJD5_9BACL|nr:aminotransferase class I/II-fold pyridoxal phosphate-dependent enzyme [Lysinibacillus yapensis]RHW39449.1 pyridoxal phosphate-dependent class II aminotransferase [Lysinibacillus yapensis]
MQLPSHGANPGKLYESFNMEVPQKIIDLSENVNAQGLPLEIQEMWPQLADLLPSYPDELADPLRTKLSAHHRLPVENVLVSNGASESLAVIARYFRGKKACILQPSFSEYERTLLAANVQVSSLLVDDITHYSFSITKAKQAMNEAEVLYICNPNNPTGVLIEADIIEQLLEYGQNNNCAIVVDEAFMDWANEEETMIRFVSAYENLIIVRSMTKMYSLAGIRIGYILSQLAPSLRQFLPHWNVSNVAISIGERCLELDNFVQHSVQLNESWREELKAFLKQYNCEVSNSRTNYLLFKLPEPFHPDDFFKALLKQGIVLRHTYNFIGLDGQWFRIAIKTPAKLSKFKIAFTNYVQSR